MRKITDEELIDFFNNLKEIIQAQKELNHVLHKRIGNLEERLSTNETKVDELDDLEIQRIKKQWESEVKDVV
jgi:copper homeostasis protein CutC